MGRTRQARRPHFAWVALVVTFAPPAASQVRQDGVDVGDREHKAEAPERPEDMPLAELPAITDAHLEEPRPLAIEAIERILADVVSSDASVRRDAQRTLLEAKDDWVSALSRRIDKIAERADRPEMTALFERSRDKARNDSTNRPEKDDPLSDYLTAVLEYPEVESQAWRDLVQVLALTRMLTAIGSTEANREIIRIYVRFGEFMRIDCQRQLESLGDLSVAALIETLRHQAPAVASWARTRLKLRGKLAPHDAVRTDNPKALSDILVALGRNGDPDSAQLLISFAKAEDPRVRKAARQGLAHLGEAGSWQLRDAYLSATGRRPPRDWTWKRAARELFTEFDRLRLERLYEIYADAKKAKEAGSLEEMRKGYDRILTQSPEFESGAEMVDGYRKYAQAVAEKEPDNAILALRRAIRIDKDEKSREATEAQLLLLEAKALRSRGIIDTNLLTRAERLDPSVRNEGSRLMTPGTGVVVWGKASRYFVAIAVTVLALLGAAWVLLPSLRKRPLKNTPMQADDED